MCYIDYSKAFDSVPHDWLLKVLEIYKIHPKIQCLLRYLMEGWSTGLTCGGRALGHVSISRGIFQGDSLSPLWFCLALNPLSHLLNSTMYGYRLDIQDKETKINHLLFMDDIKLYAESKSQLASLIQLTEAFSRDINMTFGLDKCAIISITRGTADRQADGVMNIKSLLPGETYRYLGISQNNSVQHTALKEEFRNKYQHRLTKLLNSELNGVNLITAINTWAVSSLIYSFGVLKYSDTDLRELDTLTRRLLTKFRCHHPRSAVQRLYLPRSQGGRGLINIAELCLRQEIQIREYFLSSPDRFIQKLAACDKNYTPLNLCEPETSLQLPSNADNVASWQDKVLHGKYPNILKDTGIDRGASLEWLRKGYLIPETEGFIISIQDGVIRTRNYEKHIMKMNSVDVCRRCNKPGETIEHITAGCSALADTEYLSRHNQIAKVIHREFALKYHLAGDLPPYYKYLPEPVMESGDVLLYWDRPIITDRTIDYNRPDIVVIEKMSGVAMIVDIACPLNHNIKKTELEKISKYGNLARELENIWSLQRVDIIPLVISVSGIVSTNLKRNIARLGLPEPIFTNIQKAAILQTCHIVRKFLSRV